MAWGPKMCCRCGGEGHYANKCKLPILPPQKEKEPERD